ncbi:MAG TPA: putative glycoside hydrolase [Spirochaetota bacterium]|nr:putative glycoside hydrolase [Spirochaetota bacterium]
MPKKIKYFAGAGVAVIASVFIFASVYSGAVYASDYARSMIIRAFSLYGSPDATVSVISAANFKKCIKTFSSLPRGMTHFAGVIFYRAPQNMSVHDFSEQTIELTEYYRIYEMEQSLAGINRITGNIINAGELVIVKDAAPPFVPDNRANRAAAIPYVRGVYFTGDSAGSSRFLEKLPVLKAAGINAIVFDVKDITGVVHTGSSVEQVKKFNLNRHGAIDNLPKLIRECRRNGMYVIARIAVFRDHLLYESDPLCRIKSRSTGGEWNPGEREKWCDPTSSRVQEYNISLACELADYGVDEVQFDYIRFPTVGDQDDAAYAWSSGKMEKTAAVAAFLKNAHQRLRAKNCFLSIDIFGVVAWGKNVDIEKTGQQVDLLAANCDVISPMLYPSHFNNAFDGFARPGDNPYHFVMTGCIKVRELAGKGRVIVRPWLQAFAWRVSKYNASYIAEQVKGSADGGGYGYLFWNASNKYDEVIQGMAMVPAGR